VVLRERLRAAIARLNPHVPMAARDEALARVLRAEAPGLLAQNRAFHKLLVDGVPVEYQRPDGSIRGDVVALVDWHSPIATTGLPPTSSRRGEPPPAPRRYRRLPQWPAAWADRAEESRRREGHPASRFNQLQTYKQEISTLCAYNEILVVSDGREALTGTLTADWERFMPWKTIDGSPAPTAAWQLEVLIRGIFAPARLLDLVRHFIVFEVDGPNVSKKLAAYHQYHAVRKAVSATLDASSADGDRKAGVVWHTQGSGKSLTMAFYAGKIVLEPAMANPTLVVLTDRNDLDDQLFAAFAGCTDLLRQVPVQARDREHLRELLQVASGGIIFTTVQKFLPPDEDHPPAVAGVRVRRAGVLSARKNIVFIADKAHRSQYGFKERTVLDEQRGEVRKLYGFATHMRDALPNASYIGFTGTPVEQRDHNTRAIFGDYIDIYDIQQAVAMGHRADLLRGPLCPARPGTPRTPPPRPGVR